MLADRELDIELEKIERKVIEDLRGRGTGRRRRVHGAGRSLDPLIPRHTLGTFDARMRHGCIVQGPCWTW